MMTCILYFVIMSVFFKFSTASQNISHSLNIHETCVTSGSIMCIREGKGCRL